MAIGFTWFEIKDDMLQMAAELREFPARLSMSLENAEQFPLSLSIYMLIIHLLLSNETFLWNF